MSRHPARALAATLRLRPAGDAASLRDAWRALDARAAAAAVAWEGGTQWLLRRLAALGLEDAVPEAVGAALRARASAERAHGLLVDAEADGVLRLLNERGVPCVAIKGTARRAAAARYPFADARDTLDVDLLLPAARVEETWNDLRSRGWDYVTEPSATPAGHYHPPPLKGPNGIGVELHRSTGPGVAPAEAWRRATRAGEDLVWHGVPVRVPNATELLWHGLAHAVQMGPAGFRLRYFLDGASIMASGAALDWELVASRLAAGDEADPRLARAWLAAAADLAGPPPVPAAADGGFDLERALAWRLRVLAGGDGAFRERLLEEGTRAELGVGTTPVVAGTGPFRQARRWVAGRVARAAYRAWRTTAGPPPGEGAA